MDETTFCQQHGWNNVLQATWMEQRFASNMETLLIEFCLVVFCKQTANGNLKQ